MPIYAYRCSACGHEEDKLQKLSDPLLTVCPACGQSTYTKQVTAAGFQLKGSGWYVTDFRDNGAKPSTAPTSTTAATAATAGKEGGEGAAKPATESGASSTSAAATTAPATTSASSASPASTAGSAAAAP